MTASWLEKMTERSDLCLATMKGAKSKWWKFFGLEVDSEGKKDEKYIKRPEKVPTNDESSTSGSQTTME